MLAFAAVTMAGLAVEASSQALPNPYRAVDGWARLPDGREMGAVGGVTMDSDGEHVWAVVRCDATDPARFGNECLDSDLDPIIKFNLEGDVVASFGGGMFIWPHGIYVDRDGNVWVTEAGSGESSQVPGLVFGHQVFKFSPLGELLMTLGEAGVPGDGPYHLISPSDVVTGPNGDIFVVDGHNQNGNNRIVRYSSDGTFIKAFGETGHGPGQLYGPHAIAMDANGRLFVADRQNMRIVIFDQEGNFVNRWTQFGMPSDIAIDNGKIYVADSESDMTQNPGWEKGIRIGDVETGWVEHFILDTGDNPPITAGGSGAESLTVDRHGSIYSGEPRPQRVRKYVKVR